MSQPLIPLYEGPKVHCTRPFAEGGGEKWWGNGGDKGGGEEREDGYTRTLFESMMTAKHSILPPGAQKRRVVYPFTFEEIIQIQDMYKEKSYFRDAN